MQTKRTTITQSEDFGGSGPLLHFAHANGYPPACYRPLLAQFANHYHVWAALMRPLWPGACPADLAGWRPLADELLTAFEQFGGQPEIAVGHSIGANLTLRAALQQPGLFRALVLIEPVLFAPWMSLAWGAVYHLGLAQHIHPLTRSTARRKRSFAGLEAAFEQYRPKTVFRYMSDAALRACLEGLLRPGADGGCTLRYTPEWEMRIYATGVRHDLEIWRGLARLKLPVLVLRGAETDTFSASTAARFQRCLPAARIISLPQATHLAPLECPEQVFELVQAFLQEVQ